MSDLRMDAERWLDEVRGLNKSPVVEEAERLIVALQAELARLRERTAALEGERNLLYAGLEDCEAASSLPLTTDPLVALSNINAFCFRTKKKIAEAIPAKTRVAAG